jgi:uncharacterized protein (DUF1330 family)
MILAGLIVFGAATAAPSASTAAPSAVAAPTMATTAPNPDVCDNRPVVMMVEGQIRDTSRLRVYAEAIRGSGLYPQLAGYYLISPRPVAVFEGTPPPERSLLAVRFPCLAHARAFWYSRRYQQEIVPLRSDPPAGDFLVTVHLELPVPAYLTGKVGDGAYVPDAGSMQGIEQLPETAE